MHGAWTGGWIWRDVAERMHAAGNTTALVGTPVVSMGPDVKLRCTLPRAEPSPIWAGLVPPSTSPGAVPFEMVSVLANKCVDIAEWNPGNAAVLHLWTCVGGANQKWRRG